MNQNEMETTEFIYNVPISDKRVDQNYNPSQYRQFSEVNIQSTF